MMFDRWFEPSPDKRWYLWEVFADPARSGEEAYRFAIRVSGKEIDGTRSIVNNGYVDSNPDLRPTAPIPAPAGPPPAPMAMVPARAAPAPMEVIENNLTNRLPSAKRQVSDAATSSWSPDGRRIAYGKMPFGAGIEIVDVATGKTEGLSKAGKDPAWASGEGRWIAFVEGDSDQSQYGPVCLVEPSGENLRKIDALAFHPTWGGDGKTLYYWDKTDRTLKSVDASAQESNATDVIDIPQSHCPSVSPDRRCIAFASKRELQMLDRDTDKPPSSITLPTSGFLFHAWSPDGKRIALGCCYGKPEEQGLWILDVDSRQYREVVRGPFTMPAWSPDGTRLSFDLRDGAQHEIWMIETKDLEALPLNAVEPEPSP